MTIPSPTQYIIAHAYPIGEPGFYRVTRSTSAWPQRDYPAGPAGSYTGSCRAPSSCRTPWKSDAREVAHERRRDWQSIPGPGPSRSVRRPNTWALAFHMQWFYSSPLCATVRCTCRACVRVGWAPRRRGWAPRHRVTRGRRVDFCRRLVLPARLSRHRLASGSTAGSRRTGALSQ